MRENQITTCSMVSTEEYLKRRQAIEEAENIRTKPENMELPAVLKLAELLYI